jgi:hypothetical protein
VPHRQFDTPGKGRISSLALPQFALMLLFPLLMWPAIVNGGPFFFPDTTAYVRSVDALAVKVLHRESDWTSYKTRNLSATSGPDTVPTNPKKVDHAPIASSQNPPVLAGRSPFYGALAYFGVLSGSFLTVVILQAIAAIGVLLGAVRHAIDPSKKRAFAIAACIMVLVATLTPLPYFVSMIMPDIFAGLAIVAAAVLGIGWRRERIHGRAAWFAVMAYAALTHSATTLILIALVFSVAIAALLFRGKIWAPAPIAATTIAAAALVGLAGDAVFSYAVTRMTGQPPIRPPFMTARLTADGAGTDYLNSHCQTQKWLLCKYRNRLPLPSDDFLWRPDGKHGVFMTLPPAEARALAAEQPAFSLAVFKNDPIAVMRSSGKAVLEQASHVGFEEFTYPVQMMDGFAEKMPADLVAEVRQTAAAHGTMPGALIEMLCWPFVAFSLLFTGWAWRQQALRPQASIATFIILGCAINVIICGAMSTPHDRYNMRALWALPIAAVLVVAAAIQRRKVAPNARHQT